MGRPIQKKWFRDGTGRQIDIASAKWANGSTANADAYIESQVGTSTYRVVSATDAKSENLKLSNLNTLAAGEMRITATPFGGSALRVSKIQQHRVTVWTTTNDPLSAVAQYAWEDLMDPNDTIADAAGEADISMIADEDVVAATADVVMVSPAVTDDNQVDYVIVTSGSSGYTSAPAVTFTTATGLGTTATGVATIRNGVVVSVEVTDPGSYEDVDLPITVTIDAPV